MLVSPQEWNVYEQALIGRRVMYRTVTMVLRDVLTVYIVQSALSPTATEFYDDDDDEAYLLYNAFYQ